MFGTLLKRTSSIDLSRLRRHGDAFQVNGNCDMNWKLDCQPGPFRIRHKYSFQGSAEQCATLEVVIKERNQTNDDMDNEE